MSEPLHDRALAGAAPGYTACPADGHIPSCPGHTPRQPDETCWCDQGPCRPYHPQHEESAA